MVTIEQKQETQKMEARRIRHKVIMVARSVDFIYKGIKAGEISKDAGENEIQQMVLECAADKTVFENMKKEAGNITRYALDSLAQKMFNIDIKLSSGKISEQEAKVQRKAVINRADRYAMVEELLKEYEKNGKVCYNKTV